MSIPAITEAVCLAVVDEVKRRGVLHLAEGLDCIQKTQPALVKTLGTFIDKVIEVHGTLAAESLTRLLVLQYKIIETQIVVNELEEEEEL